MTDRVRGTVAWFDNRKGYGFIQQETGGDDIFVHYREIRGEGFKTLKDGQAVEFGIIDSDKGLQAQDVAAVAE